MPAFLRAFFLAILPLGSRSCSPRSTLEYESRSKAEKRRSVSAPATMEDLKKLIREVPDLPKPGILFYDITTLLKDKADSGP